MVLLPTDPNTLTIDCEQAILQVGSNPDTYTAVFSLRPTIRRRELRKTTTIGTAYYFHGAADNELIATLMMSLNEFISFNNNLTPDGTGQLPIVYFKIQYTDLAGTTKTLGNTVNTPTGFAARVVEVMAPSDLDLGGVECRLKIRIIDDVLTVT